MKSIPTKTLALIPLMTALLAVFAWISVPYVVPFTLQTMAVFLAAGLLGWKGGTLAVALYLLLGAVGLPVFAGFKGGAAALLGPTGGYLIGFLATAVLVGALGQRFTRWWQSALAMAAGLLACYALGTAWFVAVYTQTKGPVGVGAALMWCVVPYLLPDAVKIALSVVLVQKLRPVLSRMGFERW